MANVLIFGLGVNQGGVGATKFFVGQGANIRVTDLKTKKELKKSIDELKGLKIKYTLGKHINKDVDWADLIIKNPAIKPGNKYLYYAQKKKKQIETDMGIFFRLVNRNQIIGITGTKGKSTTASLIYEALKTKYKNTVLAGNIGKSVLDTIKLVDPETLIVLEVSSFQMEGLIKHQSSPKYALITNIYPDHLNYHPTMNSYIEAKRMIAFYQKSGDFLFLNRDDPTLNKLEFIENLKAKIILYSKTDLPETFKPTLPGEHNRQNYAAALTVAKGFGIEENKALKSMNKFKGVEFRLQTIKIWNKVKIINDTTATSPNASIHALKTYPNSILIAGGMNKGMPYQEFAETIDKCAKKVYFLIGDSTDEIKRLMKNKELIMGTYNNLNKLLIDVKSKAQKGDVILFSPGATSFNLFQNEFDRGREFNKAIDKIFQ